jgi:hypothetical protein
MLIGIGLVLVVRKTIAQLLRQDRERNSHCHPTEELPLPAPNVLPNAPQDFLLWPICIFPNKFHLDG